jgi:hypothetical protein
MPNSGQSNIVVGTTVSSIFNMPDRKNNKFQWKKRDRKFENFVQ